MSKIKELPVIHEDVSDYEKIEKEISDLLLKEFYEPLMAIFKQQNLLKNSIEGLISSIKSGQIFFHHGEFKGRFNSMITRELKKLGAVWDKKHGSFKILFAELPVDVKDAIKLSEAAFERAAFKLNKRLERINPKEIVKSLDITKLFDTAIFKLDKKIEKNIEKVGIHIKFSPESRKKIVDEYVEDTEKSIVDFIETQTVKLRDVVMERARTGLRYEGLVKEIMDSHKVGISKARFLARQETKLAYAKIKETRYIDAGIPTYKWRAVVGSKDHPVRHRHQELSDMSQLHGKVFRWDDPPVTSEDGEKERKNNPQQDYNCRCSAVPVIDFKK